MSGGISERRHGIRQPEAAASKLHDAALMSTVNGRLDELREPRTGLSGTRVQSRRRDDVQGEAQDQHREKSEHDRDGRGKSMHRSRSSRTSSVAIPFDKLQFILQMRLGRADAVRVPEGIALQSRSPGMRLALAGRLRLVLGRLPAAVSTMPGSLFGLNTAASLSVRSFLSVRLGNAAITGVPRRTLLQFTSQGVRLVLQFQLSRLLRSSKEEIWYRQLNRI